MSGTFWQRLTQGVARTWHRSDWPDFAGRDWTADIMDRPVTDRFHAKQGRSVGRLILTALKICGAGFQPAIGPDRLEACPTENRRRISVYLKRHYRLAWWRGLLATFWPGSGWSPALEEWHHLEWAKKQGLPVPEPVAAGETIGPWGRLQSFLAIEELAGMLALHEAIPLAAQRLTPRVFRRWKAGLIGEMARLAQEFHGRRYFHKDLYLCHFYVPEADTSRSVDPSAWRGRVHVIDLHRLGRHRWAWPFWLVKDLAQLLYSSEVVGVDDRDRLHFWKAYLGGRQHSLVHRWLGVAIRFKWRRYRRHNQKGRRAATPGAAA